MLQRVARMSAATSGQSSVTQEGELRNPRWLCFYRLWLWRAIRRSFGSTDGLLAFGTIAIGFIGWWTNLEFIAQVPVWVYAVLVFVVVFGVRLLCAPYWIYRDALETIERLRAEVEQFKMRQEPLQRTASARLTLANLRTDGVKIRNAGQNLKDKDEAIAWIAETGEWMQRTIAAIETVDEADAEWFATLDAVPPPRVQLYFPAKHHEGAHLKAFREHDFRLHKLEQLIERYSAKSA